MPFADIDPSLAVAPVLAPKGEYKLRCVSARDEKNEDGTSAGRTSFAMQFIANQDGPLNGEYENFFHSFFHPTDEQMAALVAKSRGMEFDAENARKANFKLLQKRERLRGFGFSEDARVAPEDFVGKEIWAIVAIETDKKGVYPDKNVIKKYVKSAS